MPNGVVSTELAAQYRHATIVAPIIAQLPRHMVLRNMISDVLWIVSRLEQECRNATYQCNGESILIRCKLFCNVSFFGGATIRNSAIRGTRSDYGRLSSFGRRPAFRGRRTRRVAFSRRSRNVAFPNGQPVRACSRRSRSSSSGMALFKKPRQSVSIASRGATRTSRSSRPDKCGFALLQVQSAGFRSLEPDKPVEHTSVLDAVNPTKADVFIGHLPVRFGAGLGSADPIPARCDVGTSAIWVKTGHANRSGGLGTSG